jgi:putative tricarboxylic transport membrane protein
VNAPKRLPGAYADVPTWKELGVDTHILAGPMLVLGPKALPAEQIAYWDEAFSKLVRTDEWIADAKANFRSLEYMNSTDTKAYLKAEYEALRKMIPALGIARK